MGAVGDLVAYGRFTAALPAFLRQQMTVDRAGSAVRRRLASRQEAFLATVRQGVFARPESPYHRLFELAGCTLGDLEGSLRREGVEGALKQLQRAGVYLAFDEFKGRVPLVRHGVEIPVPPRAFESRAFLRSVRGSTSGTTGAATRVSLDLEHLAVGMAGTVLMLDAHGLVDAPSAVWLPPLPSLAGVSIVLRSAARGAVAERWFTPVAGADFRAMRKDRLAMAMIHAVGALCGVSLPRPREVAMEDAATVARWVADALERRGRCMLHAHVSGLVRVAVAAGELGLDLRGAAFSGGGETPTESKVSAIRGCGARFVPTYYLAEAGAVGLACADAEDPTDVHFMADALAVIESPADAGAAGGSVPALSYTTLLPTAPKLLINVESNDVGVLEERRCSCRLGEIGLERHIRQVHSYRKLTGEGISLIDSDMMRILEQVLPRRFGGSPLDYQLAEEEDAGGLTRIVLRVHPRVAIPSEAAVRDAILSALADGDAGAVVTRALWRAGDTLVVLREEPRLTAQGKLHPILTRGVAGLGRPPARSPR